jgi:hypothetical protein
VYLEISKYTEKRVGVCALTSKKIMVVVLQEFLNLGTVDPLKSYINSADFVFKVIQNPRTLRHNSL